MHDVCKKFYRSENACETRDNGGKCCGAEISPICSIYFFRIEPSSLTFGVFDVGGSGESDGANREWLGESRGEFLQGRMTGRAVDRSIDSAS